MIRQGFDQYVSMRDAKTFLGDLGLQLDNMAHWTPHKMFGQYANEVCWFSNVMADLQLYGVMMCCVSLEDNKDGEHDNKEEERADVGLEQEVEGEGGVDYTDYPCDDKEDDLLMLILMLGNSDAVDLIEQCGTYEKENKGKT